MSKTIAIISAGLNQPSSTRLLSDRLGESTMRWLDEAGIESNLVHVDLRDLAHDITDNLLTGFPAPALKAAIHAVVHADAVIAVTPIFTSSYSGLFKSFFDVLDNRALAGMPVLVGATGGTARHSLALEYAVRPLFAYLQSVVVPTSVFAASEDWGGASATHGELASRIDRAAHELAQLVSGRSAEHPEEEEIVPFAEQLARLAVSA
jgi:FMN reductase